MTNVELDVVFHLDEVSPDDQHLLTERFHHAGRWLVDQFGIERLSVSISVVDDGTIRRLNAQYLQHDWATDVVSFVFQSGPEVSGEIIASWTTADRLSRLAQWSASDELVLYVLHGMLHLAGLDDVDDLGRQQMRTMEKGYLVAAEVPGAESYLERFDRVVDDDA
jgi:probable rRNA maturation factor